MDRREVRWGRIVVGAVLAVALFLPAPPVRASESTAGPDPLYRRDEHSHRIEKAPEGERLPRGLPLRTGRHAFPSDIHEMDGEATETGRWTAGELARRTGSWIYYRAGFYDGIHTALHVRPDAGADYSDGLRWGSRDPGALSHGEVAGAAAADEAARGLAAQRVEAQFMDLSEEPVFQPVNSAPVLLPVVAGIVAPSLDDVLLAVHAGHVQGLSRRFDEAFGGWRFDPPGLFRASGYKEFVEESWADAEGAFDFWLQGKRRSAFYRTLQVPSDRQRFREIFMAAYSARMVMLLEEDLAYSYGLGRKDGWRYGVVVVAEWRYRMGYAEGFSQAAATASLAAYTALFPEAYRRHYGDQHRTWSRTARPGIVSFRIEDAGGDGIFQPGESVHAQVEVANYGGAPGTWTAVIDSPVFREPVEISLVLPPRRVTSVPGSITAAVREDVARGRQEEVVLEGGTLIKSIPILVSYPLQFTGRARLAEADVIEGSATAQVEVVNRSRRTLDGRVTLRGGAGVEVDRPERAVSKLTPGEVRRLEFDLHGIDPLEALAGSVGFMYEIRGPDSLHDELAYTFPAIALDLGSRELERFLLALAVEARPSSHEMRVAVELVLERIAADWDVATQGPGNPYKHDYKERDGTTALGELVRSYHRERARFRSLDIFTRLGGEIELLADDLPGVHPLLRKYLKRLARQLG